MRVVSGTLRGRKLAAPVADAGIRATTDRVKEAIFDIIQFDLEGRLVVDLFAGSGQLGIEAISRGAANVVFVDESKDALNLVRKNLEKCGLESSYTAPFQVVQADAISYLKRAGKVDIILLDPPYKTNLMKKSLDMIKHIDILENGGIIVCESGEVQDEMEGFKRKVYKYGKTTALTVFTRLTEDESQDAQDNV
jgi:16S rRNA (guanine(966)-N(2))-methyltransferase RsmD